MKKTIHSIRLLGPWNFEWDESQEHSGMFISSGTTNMPRDWRSLFGNVAGTATFTRRFHRPSNLEPHEQVWLVCRGIGGSGELSLNKSLKVEFASRGEAIEFDVTSALEQFNHLSIRLTLKEEELAIQSSDRLGLFDAVALDIRIDE